MAARLPLLIGITTVILICGCVIETLLGYA